MSSMIDAQNICLRYRVRGAGRSKFSGPSAPTNMVEIDGKQYISALDGVDFTIRNTQRIGIVGRNGSGKSTLLRVLGGVYEPTEGRLRIAGKISSMFNMNLGVQPDATGRENIVIRGLVKEWRMSKINDHMDQIIDFSELKDFIDLPLRTYSDGMRMRLLFAIATSFEPEILLLDEWIGAGDAKFQLKAANRMNELVEKAGIVVIASHNRGLLKRVCDYAIWLDQGKMVAFDEINEIYRMMDLAKT